MTRPLVSCIVPTTAARTKFLRHAIDYFTAQTYKPLQLVVVGDEGSIGHKRNVACEMAKGEIICHWDDDDWYGPRRVQEQVEAMLDLGLEATGYSRILFADDAKREVYQYDNGSARYGIGATLMYRRSLWESLQFKDSNCGEDNNFVYRIPREKYLAVNGNQIVARVHDGNTVEKRSKLELWGRTDWARLEAIGYQAIL